MLFNSAEFVVFFAAIASLYYALPRAAQNPLLLAASYFFYAAWEPAYLLLIWAATLSAFAAARSIARARTRAARRSWLALGIAVNLGLLAYFKYYNFFAEALRPICAMLMLPELPLSPWLLPVGISFYTFQTLSYLLDVYRGGAPEQRLDRFALYIAFFPQLVAGPIERAHRILPQLAQPRFFDYESAVFGLQRMAWGLFKKVVIADRLAQVVDYIYLDPSGKTGPAVALATVFIAYQYYCDFSAYCDIALGAAQVLGIRLMENFARPFAARSIRELWRRWHISLMTWFRDYLYIPLGGNRHGPWVHYRNLLIVFVISGLWHGAGWGFIIWGMLHGTYIVAGLATQPLRARLAERLGLIRFPRLLAAWQLIVTFSLFAFSFIFFGAQSVSDAARLLAQLPLGWTALFSAQGLAAFPGTCGVSTSELLFALALLPFLEGVQYLQRAEPLRPRIARLPLPLRWTLYSALLWAIFTLGIFRHKAFLYYVF